MRIPLDYYRILGLPIQATADQLKQAHRDRTLQLPRREYSEVAIEARKALIDEAYGVLSDPKQRQEYDTQFLAKTTSVEATLEAAKPGEGMTETGEAALRSLASDAEEEAPPPAIDSYTPTIEIDDTQLVGALLILLELGEYELVIRLGRPYISSGSVNLADGQFGDPKRVLADIVLTLSLACLELGREQWQQRQYEDAAESLETGQELLARESIFPAIRGELQSDLYKLRPYRVLELVARSLENTTERRRGIQLLKNMLQDRDGIDGAEDDLSGLTTDDFLRFIQQLRGYLTAGEQQEIFEAEARRPSAVSTYLAVYALLARGFAFHQPALVSRAKQLVMRISSQQDVHLEQAVCALLLGQTEEASRALERSQEYEPLAFIREHSQNAPDLLPGLCLYAERWLREEVFPYFRDLAGHQTALKDYFADAQVQAYLESLPANAAATEAATPPSSWSGTTATSTTSTNAAAPVRRPTKTPPSWERAAQEAAVPKASEPASPLPRTFQGPQSLPNRPREVVESAAAPTVAERVSQLSPEGQLQAPGSASTPTRQGAQNGRHGGPPPPPRTPPRRRPSTTSPRWGRLVGVLLLGLFGLGVLGFATMRTLSWIGALFSGPRIQQPALDIQIGNPPIAIPPPPEPEATISVEDIAQRAVENWLAAKREALGAEHNVNSLNAVLAEPALTQWRNRANGAQRENWYWEYDHAVEVLEVTPDDPTAEAMTVTAEVRETAELYEFGERNFGASYDETLTMRYELVRQDGEWLVEDMTKVE